MKTVILNTDNSVVHQKLGRNYAIDTIDLIDLRPGLQFYADARSRAAFHRRVSVNAASPAVRLLGSGDFHHLTLMMLEQLAEPFVLVVFDNHIDCSMLGPKYHCGNWMFHAALLPACRSVLHCGATETVGLFSRYSVGRLAMRNKLRQIRGSDMLDANCGERILRELALQNPGGMPVYLSVDKDVLRQEESPGDWDNGVMTLPVLTAALEQIARRNGLAGADITGEKGGTFYYPYRPLKNILSWIEHHDCPDPTPFVDAVARQQAINTVLLDALGADRVD